MDSRDSVLWVGNEDQLLQKHEVFKVLGCGSKSQTSSRRPDFDTTKLCAFGVTEIVMKFDQRRISGNQRDHTAVPQEDRTFCLPASCLE